MPGFFKNHFISLFIFEISVSLERHSGERQEEGEGITCSKGPGPDTNQGNIQTGSGIVAVQNRSAFFGVSLSGLIVSCEVYQSRKLQLGWQKSVFPKSSL